jgi:hypothetical protein
VGSSTVRPVHRHDCQDAADRVVGKNGLSGRHATAASLAVLGDLLLGNAWFLYDHLDYAWDLLLANAGSCTTTYLEVDPSVLPLLGAGIFYVNDGYINTEVRRHRSRPA